MKNLRATSPKLLAKLAAISFLMIIVFAAFALGYVSKSLIVYGDAGATASNIMANKRLYNISYSMYIMEMICQLLMVVFFYLLLKPAGPKVAFTSLCIGLVGTGIKTLSQLFFLAPLFILNGADYWQAFTKEQLDALVFFLIQTHSQGLGLAIVFLGLGTVLNGYLIIKSEFLPKILGYLSIAGGIGVMTYLYPPLGNGVFNYAVLVNVIGAFVIIFWLLKFGVNEKQWLLRAQNK